MSAILELANPFHAYVFGTSFWYFLRGIMRVIDPAAVCSWFRPPVDGEPTPNDLELYTTRTDAFCLLALAAVLLAVSDAVELPKSLSGSALAEKTVSRKAKKPYARAIVVITILHHVATGIGAYGHWRLPTHHTVAMDIGVYGNIGLTALGVVALVYGLQDGGTKAINGKKRA